MLWGKPFTRQVIRMNALVLAAGGSEYLTSLDSMTQLMQYLKRLQVGGERALKPDEIQVLKEVWLQYKSLYDLYEKIMASNGDIVSSQNTKLAELRSKFNLFYTKKSTSIKWSYRDIY